MTLHEILAGKGSAVQTIPPGATVRETAQRLVQFRIGALLVCDDAPSPIAADHILGIVSERDVLRACVGGASLERLRVSEVMTTQVHTVTLDDTVENVMGLMTARRVRHLPVLAEGRLVGIVSIGDLVKSQLGRLAVENQFLKDYIQS